MKYKSLNRISKTVIIVISSLIAIIVFSFSFFKRNNDLKRNIEVAQSSIQLYYKDVLKNYVSVIKQEIKENHKIYYNEFINSISNSFTFVCNSFEQLGFDHNTYRTLQNIVDARIIVFDKRGTIIFYEPHFFVDKNIFDLSEASFKEFVLSNQRALVITSEFLGEKQIIFLKRINDKYVAVFESYEKLYKQEKAWLVKYLQGIFSTTKDKVLLYIVDKNTSSGREYILHGKNIKNDYITYSETINIGIFEWQIYAAIPARSVEEAIAQVVSKMKKKAITDIYWLALLTFFLSILTYFSISFLFGSIAKDFKKFYVSLHMAIKYKTAPLLKELKYIEYIRVLKDIKELLDAQKRIEKESKQKHLLLLAIFAAVQEAIVVTNDKGLINYFNNSAAKMFSTDISGKTIECLFKSAKQVDKNEIVINDKKYHYTASPIKIDSKSKGVVYIFRDVTEEEQIALEKQRYERLYSLSLLAAGVAHDFNNILSGIYGNIQLAQLKLSQNKIENVKEFLALAVESMQRAIALTRQLRALSKGDAPIMEVVDIKNIIKTVTKFNLSGSNIKPHFAFEENLWSIKADPGQIGDVITNIVINAKQAMPDGGNIYIKARNVVDKHINPFRSYKGKFVEISIADEGPGIPADQLDKIFDPYFSTKGAGNGLGLAIVHSIVLRHGGHIVVNSDVGKGTVFTILLPATCTEQKKKEEDDSYKNISSMPTKKIMVVDDEEAVRNVLKEILESLGHHVNAFGNPREALEKFKQELKSGRKYDLVIMDLTMPGEKGGQEIIQNFIKLDPTVKTIACSGYVNGKIMEEYKSFGFDGRISKPFSIEKLQEELAQIFS